MRRAAPHRRSAAFHGRPHRRRSAQAGRSARARRRAVRRPAVVRHRLRDGGAGDERVDGSHRGRAHGWIVWRAARRAAGAAAHARAVGWRSCARPGGGRRHRVPHHAQRHGIGRGGRLPGRDRLGRRDGRGGIGRAHGRRPRPMPRRGQQRADQHDGPRMRPHRGLVEELPEAQRRRCRRRAGQRARSHSQDRQPGRLRPDGGGYAKSGSNLAVRTARKRSRGHSRRADGLRLLPRVVQRARPRPAGEQPEWHLHRGARIPGPSVNPNRDR